MSPTLIGLTQAVVVLVGAIITSGITAWISLRVAQKGRATPAEEMRADFKELFAQVREEREHMAERVAHLEARVAILEKDKHILRNQVAALRKRAAMHDEDRVRRDLPPLAWPAGTNVEDLMGMGYVADYGPDGHHDNGPRDNKRLGKDAADFKSLRGKRDKDEDDR
jgi:hypothetical protein